MIRTTVPALADAGDILIAVASHHVARVKRDRRCQWTEVRCHVCQRAAKLSCNRDGNHLLGLRWALQDGCSAALVLDRSGSKKGVPEAQISLAKVDGQAAEK